MVCYFVKLTVEWSFPKNSITTRMITKSTRLYAGINSEQRTLNNIECSLRFTRRGERKYFTRPANLSAHPHTAQLGCSRVQLLQSCGLGPGQDKYTWWPLILFPWRFYINTSIQRGLWVGRFIKPSSSHWFLDELYWLIRCPVEPSL